MLYKEQGNVCAICSKPTQKQQLEHGHRKLLWPGIIRGVCCPTCNRREGKLANDWKKMQPQEMVNWMRACADYLEGNINRPKNIVHPAERNQAQPASAVQAPVWFTQNDRIQAAADEYI